MFCFVVVDFIFAYKHLISFAIHYTYVSRSCITRRVCCVHGWFLRHSTVSQMELKSRLCCPIVFHVVLINTDSFIPY
jgi:hypothetical protein